MHQILPQSPIAKDDLPRIVPESLEQYRNRGGYQGLLRALDLGPDAIQRLIKDAGLRGRGGAAFPTHIKWQALSEVTGEKYLVVNGAEGEPGAFKDRFLMTSAPHHVLEGVIITGLALGVSAVIFYINDHFVEAIEGLKAAMTELQQMPWNIDGRIGFEVKIVPETHVYIAGEETALISVLNGGPAQPWRKPPYPTTQGYHGKPTVVNNVETMAHVALILRTSAEWYRENRPALFSVDGDVALPGVYELPLGTSLENLLVKAGGDQIQRVLPGGYSMPWLEPEDYQVALDYDALKAHGTGLGASIICLGSKRDLAVVTNDIMTFFARETCGKCPLCVRGTAMLAEMLRPKGALLAPEEVEQIVSKAQKYRHKGICTYMDTAVHMAEMAAPSLS